MRTRDEQIDSLYHDYIYTALSRSDFRAHILEAESRAEQRVRAEIGRDSERLDWLEKTRSVVLEDADNGWCVTIGGIEFSLREETARNAIDAAREVE
ncbi:hypothetical protein AA0481_0608 [Acetobacter orientalis NRIC 0481]|uniref:Uncharacterized protein n=1 Tax=Acetobacter orientalis TaxID=146474 RepID=A0A0D6NML9_9PROT|nr:hypothetical protein Abor_031_031 [Acetobacter orientalis]GBR14420.1 hypothetical protein AA0481_0608 [Acetobacter orientalis NRIC 0481]GEL60890.1 hypothetical protein AOR02nite_07320 [Acetobacter orientalis]